MAVIVPGFGTIVLVTSPGARWDVIVVGAGPAGSCAALAALASGARVLIVDRSPIGRDKTCGDAVGYEALESLRRLGAAGVLHDSEAVSRYRLSVAGKVEVAGTSPVPGYVVPRAALDARLLKAALDAGAEFLQSRVSRVDVKGEVLFKDGSVVSGSCIVGADGAAGVCRVSAVERNVEPRRSRAVAVRGYLEGYELDELVIVWDPSQAGAYAWAFPLADGRVNVGYGGYAGSPAVAGGLGLMRERMEAVLTAARPDLGSCVSAFQPYLTGATLPLNSTSPKYGRGRLLLAGDAAGLVNAVSGEGIHHACLSGETAGTVAASGSSAGGSPSDQYSRVMRGLLGSHHFSMKIASMLVRPGLASAAIRASSKDPKAFDGLVGVALGSGSLSVPLASRIGFGWLKSTVG